MRHSTVAALLASLLLMPSAAMACRNPHEPSDLRDDPADAILLATIRKVEPKADKWSRWAATASVDAQLWGRAGEREISFADEAPGSCEQIGQPRPGKYYVLYLRRHEGWTSVRAMPFWWAWKSGDPRLAKLLKLFPLGPVRAPTEAEMKLVEPAEARVEWPGGKRDDYTRIYSRASAGLVSVAFFRSRTPQRFMLDHSEEFPTRASCGCQLYQQVIDLYDLEKAGKLPPFNP